MSKEALDDKARLRAESSDPPTFRHRHPQHWEQKNAEQALNLRHPTHVTFYDRANDVVLHWNSRRHRKGRPPSADTGGDSKWGKRRKMPRLFGVDLKDISWHVAMLFLVGSMFWCANGVMAFNFFIVSTDSILNAESATAFLGGALFFVGAYLSFVESLNPSRDTDFGYEIDEEAHKLYRPGRSTNGSLGRSRNHLGRHHAASHGKPDTELPVWRWWGTDWHSIGYVANAIQFFGATIFFLSVLCGLPGILPNSGAEQASGLPVKSLALWETFYWVPQIVGAPCFVISGAIFCLECQKKWYKPTIFTLGWQIGFWNFIGGWGFWICGILGVVRETGGSTGVNQWGSTFSTYWGSWAFLIGSYLQFYETLNK